LGKKIRLKRILIIGGYGNFGSLIARRLAREKDITLIIAGRSAEKARAFAEELGVAWAVLDIHTGFDAALEKLRPDIVIHTSGPFQAQGYEVARACIAQGCHYIDLADGRDFVAGIAALDEAAKEKGVLVVSGASSVPCLTSAIIDRYKPDFQHIESLDYGISTAQRTNPGLATTTAILGYTGKAFTTRLAGQWRKIYGWQGLTVRRYPEIGWRLLGYCDVPDLGLFPVRYPDIKTIRFRAGLEVPFLHLCLWVLSWMVRAGLMKSLRPAASFFSKAARAFDVFGTQRSNFHMEMRGSGHDGHPKTLTFYILTDSGHGPNIPCIPSVVLALELARGGRSERGAMPCMGLIDLQTYLFALSEYDITWQVKEI